MTASETQTLACWPPVTASRNTISAEMIMAQTCLMPNPPRVDRPTIGVIAVVIAIIMGGTASAHHAE